MHGWPLTLWTHCSNKLVPRKNKNFFHITRGNATKIKLESGLNSLLFQTNETYMLMTINSGNYSCRVKLHWTTLSPRRSFSMYNLGPQDVLLRRWSNEYSRFKEDLSIDQGRFLLQDSQFRSKTLLQAVYKWLYPLKGDRSGYTLQVRRWITWILTEWVCEPIYCAAEL